VLSAELARFLCGQLHPAKYVLILNNVPATFVRGPELIRPSVPVMTQSLDQTIVARKAKAKSVWLRLLEMSEQK